MESEADAGRLDFLSFLQGGFPFQHTHGNPVGAPKVTLHLKLEIFVRVEAEVVVEAFLVISVAAFDLAVVPRSLRPNRLMADVELTTEKIKQMDTICFG